MKTAIPDSVPVSPVPQGRGGAGQRAVIEDDARQAQAFVDRWASRVEGVSNARHRTMLRVVVGETREHRRFFEQMISGREDVLGRRGPGASTGGGVLPVRWIRQ